MEILRNIEERNNDIVKHGKIVIELEKDFTFDDWIDYEDDYCDIDLASIPVFCGRHRGTRRIRMVAVDIDGVSIGVICLKCMRFSADVDIETIKTLTKLDIRSRRLKKKQLPFSCYR